MRYSPCILRQLGEGLLLRVRIRKTPSIRELDGVRLDNMIPGTIREVSPTIGAWLIAEGFALFEMRSGNVPEPQSVLQRALARDRRKQLTNGPGPHHRRKTD